MNKYSIFFLTFVFFLTSCTPLSNEEKAKQNLVHAFAKDAKRSQGIRFFSSRDNLSTMDRSGVNLFFFSYRKVDLEEARWLLVESVEGLISYANNYTALNGNSAQLKLDSTNIKFTIWFIKKDGGFINDQYVADVYLDNGVVYYAIHDSKDCTLKSIFGESYQKALGIVQHQQNLQNLRNLNMLEEMESCLE